MPSKNRRVTPDIDRKGYENGFCATLGVMKRRKCKEGRRIKGCRTCIVLPTPLFSWHQPPYTTDESDVRSALLMPISQHGTPFSHEMAHLRVKRTEGNGSSGKVELLVFVVIQDALESDSNKPMPR